MKRFMRMMTAVSLSVFMIFVMAACGGAEEPAADEGQETSTEAAEPAAEENRIPEGTDFSSPDQIIEFGDYDAIHQLGSDMQSLGIVEEGTVIKITGIYGGAGSSSINQEKSEGVREGIMMNIEGAGDDFVYPEDGAKVEVTGVAVAGEYYTELWVPADNIKIL